MGYRPLVLDSLLRLNRDGLLANGWKLIPSGRFRLAVRRERWNGGNSSSCRLSIRGWSVGPTVLDVEARSAPLRGTPTSGRIRTASHMHRYLGRIARVIPGRWGWIRTSPELIERIDARLGRRMGPGSRRGAGTIHPCDLVQVATPRLSRNGATSRPPPGR